VVMKSVPPLRSLCTQIAVAMKSVPPRGRACVKVFKYYPRKWVDGSDPFYSNRFQPTESHPREVGGFFRSDLVSAYTALGAGSEQSTGNLEMAVVQRGGCPLRKGVVNHPVCSSKCVTTVMRQLGTRLAIERARTETLPLRVWEKHGAEQRLRGEASDAESGN